MRVIYWHISNPSSQYRKSPTILHYIVYRKDFFSQKSSEVCYAKRKSW